MFEEDLDVRNITMAGLIFAVYLFIMVIFTFVIAGPLDSIFNAFSSSANQTSSASNVQTFLPAIRTGMKIAFALGVATPIAWFIFWIFHREPDEEIIRRY